MSTALSNGAAKENIGVKLHPTKPLTRQGSHRTVLQKPKTGLSARPALGELDKNQKIISKVPVKQSGKSKVHCDSPKKTTQSCDPLEKLAPKLDIDEKYKDDPQQVAEYAQDIQRYLLQIEGKHMVKEHPLQKHATTPKMRSTLMEWMITAHDHFSLALETLHLSIWIVDKYLEKNKDVGAATLQLVGTTALFIACKYEELYFPPLGDFAFICEDVFKKRDILKMELGILNSLEMNLCRPHSITFLRRYSKIASATLEQHTLAKYLLELALLDYKLVAVKPSQIAAAALCSSISILKSKAPQENWNSLLVAGSSYDFDDFKSIVGRMAKLLLFTDKDSKYTSKDFKYEGVQQKYAKSSKMKVSTSFKLNGVFVNKLVSLCTD